MSLTISVINSQAWLKDKIYLSYEPIIHVLSI